MKKRVPIIFILTLLLLLFLTACIGDRTVKDIIITEGFKAEYELGEVPDFSGVKATIVYSDDTTKEVGADELEFGTLDTSTPGAKSLTISYKEEHSFQKEFVTTKTLIVAGVGFDPSKIFIESVALPNSLSDFSLSKDSFINKNYGYVVGDDNNFYLRLKIFAKDSEGIPQAVYSYESCSQVYLAGTDVLLEGDALSTYVTIDEKNNAFDFTEEAIGKSFTIYTRPKEIKEENIEKFTKSFTVTVVNGYNIYEAYELNYITNYSSEFELTTLYPNDTRSQLQVVADFLAYEKNATIPNNINAVVIHNHLNITPNDLPREYFIDLNRSNDFIDYLSVYWRNTTESNPHFTIHGNYFTISTSELPCVVAEGANQDNSLSNSQLFRFDTDLDRDLNFDHTKYSVTVSNLHLKDNNTISNDESKSSRAMLGLTAIKGLSQIINLNNVKLESFLISIIGEKDYQTININECKMTNSWHNHIHLVSSNPIQEDEEDPLDKSKYPRLTLIVNKSIITHSGGPAIISQTIDPTLSKNKNSGPVIRISEDSTVESWVTGTEAWFKALDIGISPTFIMQNVLNPLNNALQTNGSTIITEKTITGEVAPKRYFNLVIVNLIVPDLSNGFGGVWGQLQDKIDMDGIASIGNKEIYNMDDYTYNGTTSNYKNQTLSDVKDNAKATTLVFSTPSGGVAHTGTNSNLIVDSGSINANETNTHVTLYYFTLSIVFGNYHTID